MDQNIEANKKDLLTIAEFAKLAGVSTQLIYRFIKLGRLQETLVRRFGIVRKRIARSELEKLKETVIETT